MMNRTWQPLLSGPLADESRDCATRIADACCQLEFDDPSLASGAAGVALALAQFKAASHYAPTVERLMARAFELVSSRTLSPTLFGGFVGVALVVDRLEAANPKTGEGDTCEEIDTAVLLALNDWQGQFDLVSGLAGIGVYALARLPRPDARRALAQIVGRLRNLAVEVDGGLAWKTPANAFHAGTSQVGLDLGLAHGLPGVLPILAACAAHDIEAEVARSLCEGAVRFLFAQSLPPTRGARFAYSRGGDERWRAPSRIAWCYGDLGISLSLLSSARSLGRGDWEFEAISIAQRAAMRDSTDDGVVDASICHGAAGNAHLFNRLFQATGDETLRLAATRWVRRTLSMQVPNQGIAGYRSFVPEFNQRRSSWQAVPGLLEGAAGVAAALISASSDAEPTWDHFLCIEPPAGISDPIRSDSSSRRDETAQ
jgi:lantibiotic modifying enzyme